MTARRYATIAAALAAVALMGGCGEEVEETIENDLPVAAPAPELTAPVDTLDSISADDSRGAVP